MATASERSKGSAVTREAEGALNAFTRMELGMVRGLAVDRMGTLYVSEAPAKLYRVTPAGTISSLPSQPIADIFALATDSEDALFAVDAVNGEAYRLTAHGAVPLASLQPADVFLGPTAVACDTAGNLYIGENDASVIRRVTPAGEISIHAGAFKQPGNQDGSALKARFTRPRAIAVDRFGNIFVADEAAFVIRKVTAAGFVVTLAGKAGEAGVTVTGDLELPKPESWLYAKIDGFEVLSSASAKESNRLLKDFQMFRQALAVVQPFSIRALPPAALVLCERSGDIADFSPRGYHDLIPGGWSAASDERVSIAMNFAVKTFQPTNITELVRHIPDFAKGDFHVLQIEPSRLLFREYLRLEAARNGLSQPWLLEGLAQLAMDMEFSAKSIRYGEIDARKGAPTEPAGGATGDVSGASVRMKGGMIQALLSGRKQQQGTGVPWGNETHGEVPPPKR